MDIILILLACFGLTNILVNGVIFDKFRVWIGRVEFFRKLLDCSMCTGFWVGLYFSVVVSLYLIFTVLGVYSLVAKCGFYFMTLPFASSGVSWILEQASLVISNLALITNDIDYPVVKDK